MLKTIILHLMTIILGSGCMMDNEFTTDIDRSEISIHDTVTNLRPEVMSLNPLVIKVPSSTLVPFAEATLKELVAKKYEDSQTRTVTVYRLDVSLQEGLVVINSMITIRNRACVRRPPPWRPGVFCTPWISAPGEVTLLFSGRAENWKFITRHEGTLLKSSSPPVRAALMIFGETIKSIVHRSINRGLQKINDMDIKKKVEYFTHTQLPPNAILNARVQPDGLYLEVK